MTSKWFPLPSVPTRSPLLGALRPIPLGVWPQGQIQQPKTMTKYSNSYRSYGTTVEGPPKARVPEAGEDRPEYVLPWVLHSQFDAQYNNGSAQPLEAALKSSG